MFTLQSAIQHPLVPLIEECFGVTLTADNLISGADHHVILDGSFEEYYASNLFKKVENVDVGIDPLKVALTDFKERLIKQNDTESQVKYILENPTEFPNIHSVLSTAKKRLSYLLRDFKRYYIRPRFTLGATKEVPRNSDIFSRLKNPSGYKAMTQNLINIYDVCGDNINLNPYVILDELPVDSRYLTKSITEDYDDFFVKAHVVWKTAKTGRVIGLNSTLVQPVQNGLGDYFTEVCKRVGIDISTAQEKHKLLAMENSLTGEYATSDQSNSSDNLLRILVAFLLPEDIYNFMVAITPQHIEVDGSLYHAKMMCPQGNGYIFPLQTLVFHTLVKALQRYKGLDDFPVYVYGDDVILHNSVYDKYNRLMERLGFQPNLNKSHNSGYFRESCGGDYLYGINVRAQYATTLPPAIIRNNTDVIDWIKFINGIRRIGYYNNGGVWRSGSFLRFWVRCIHFIPENLRLYAPRIYGDTAINFESEKRYKLSYSTKSLRVPFTNRKEKHWDYYPQGGFDQEGRPYSSEFISVYNAVTTQGDKSFNDLITGIRDHIWYSYASDPTLRGSGMIPYYDNVRNIGDYRYPTVFGRVFEKYKVKKIPYSPYNTYETADDVFAMLTAKNNPISDTEFTLMRHSFKRMVRIQRLVDTLACLAKRKLDAISEVKISGDM